MRFQGRATLEVAGVDTVMARLVACVLKNRNPTAQHTMDVQVLCYLSRASSQI